MMKTYPTIDDAVAVARERRAVLRQHQAINQRHSGCYTVVQLRFSNRPAWTTLDDNRDCPGLVIKKIELSDVPLILSLITENVSISEIARKFDVDRKTIRNIRDKYS